MKDGVRTRTLLLAALLAAAGGCTCPTVRIGKYFPRETPVDAVRHFQLALDLEMWEAAAACLWSASEQVGSWRLWAASAVSIKELGGYSLRQVVSEIYWTRTVREEGADAVVQVFTRPGPNVDQLYNLALVRREGLWSLDLDRTAELNM